MKILTGNVNTLGSSYKAIGGHLISISKCVATKPSASSHHESPDTRGRRYETTVQADVPRHCPHSAPLWPRHYPALETSINQDLRESLLTNL